MRLSEREINFPGLHDPCAVNNIIMIIVNFKLIINLILGAMNNIFHNIIIIIIIIMI